jgi:uncharacterized delta-60 repeat protein
MFYTKIFLYSLFVFAFFTSAANVRAQDSADLLSGGQIDFSFEPVEIFPPLESPILIFQPDGKILAIGRFVPLSSAQNRLYRFLPNGQHDTTFNAPTDFKYDVCALQTDGKVVCSYRFYDASVTEYFKLIRLNSDGSVDATFNYTAATESEVKSIAVLPNGQILIGGFIREKVENPVSLLIARVNADGSLDHSFAPVSAGSIYERGTHIVTQPDGKILVQLNDESLQRYNPNGTLDIGFGRIAYVNQFELLPNGKILILQRIPNTTTYNLLRFNPDATADSTFHYEQTLPYGSFAVQTDGRILLNYILPSSNPSLPGVYRYERLSADGNIIQSFPSYFGGGKIYLSPDNLIFLGGARIENRNYGIVKLHGSLTATRRKAFDFDGDGKADLAVYRPSEGVWYIQNSATSTYTIVRFGLAGDIPVPADYDGDTKADIAVYRPSTGVWYWLRSSDGQFRATQFGLAEDIPTQNDYDGDGVDDISVFRPSTGVWYRINSSGGFAACQFGLSGDKPEAGDYDGDGKADFAVYRPSDGTWYRRGSIDGSYKSDHVGYYDGDIGTPADFDGDGRLDLVYYKDFTGSWYGLRSASSTGFFIQWGNTGDIPVPADFDGDGRDDLAVWRPTTGEWWIINSFDGSLYTVKFGATGDIPIQSAYVR